MILNLRRHPPAWDMTLGRAYKRLSGALLIEVFRLCHATGIHARGWKNSPRFLLYARSCIVSTEVA